MQNCKRIIPESLESDQTLFKNITTLYFSWYGYDANYLNTSLEIPYIVDSNKVTFMAPENANERFSH